MKSLICLLSFWYWSISLPAQTLHRTTTSSAWGHAQHPSLSVSFTMGEALVASHRIPSLILTEGFHQTTIEELVTGLELPPEIHHVNLYPNPAHSHVVLQVEGESAPKLMVQLYDIRGTKIPLKSPELVFKGQSQIRISLGDLRTGIYMLMVLKENGQLLKQFKIQRIN